MGPAISLPLLGPADLALLGPVISLPLLKPARPPLHFLIDEKPPPFLDLQKMIRDTREQMGLDCINHYNFAVCGQSGVGKSSFINGILGLQGDDACPIGEVETTQNIKRYFTKKAPYLMVWDMPGAGTQKHPAHTYFEDKKLFVFDAILVLSSERFLAVDFEILRSARLYKTPCLFVRTKCDLGVERKANRYKVNAFEASKRLREDVRSSFLEGLANARLRDSFSTPELFFVSNEFFFDDNAYFIYNEETDTLDTSLSSMDERLFFSFIFELAKKRAPK